MRATDPTRGRRREVYALVAVLVLGSLVAIVRDDPFGKELWPFSAFPMYSNRAGWIARSHRLFGVLREDPAREFPLIEDEYLFPIKKFRFYLALRRMEQDRDRDRVLGAALRDTLERYEANRRAGRHHGPALSGIRLYESKYRLDARATDRDHPDSRRLIFEVSPG